MRRALVIATLLSDASASSPLGAVPLAMVGGVLALAVTGMGWTLTRRGLARHATVARLSVDDLLEAGRRLTTATDRAAVARGAVAEAVAITHSTHGTFVERGHDGSFSVEPPHPLTPAELLRGPIVRALATGQSMRSQRAGRALLVVPVVHEGTVLGGLVVVRPAPYGDVETDALGRLAPLVARALHGAERSDVDSLTTVGNRRRFERDLDDLAGREQGLVVAMVDVDHFKVFNERHGHVRGDEALRAVAATLRSCVRDGDLVYRYGGAEFAILLPGATTADAAAVAERIRTMLRAESPSSPLTVSIGVASRADDPCSVVARADEARHEAKRTGRDRVVVAP